MNSKLIEDNSFLQCYICMQKLKKPRMCPNCSKLACFDCLQIWIQQKRNQCPHCRKVINLANFADCSRFIDNLMNEFKKIDKPQKSKQLCQQHQLDMQYYCRTCSIAICSDCGMFDQKHKGHNITHLNKIYEHKKNKILAEIQKFDKKVQQYKKNGLDIKIELQKLVIIMQQKKSYLEAYFANILQKLDLEFKEKQSIILTKYQNNEDQIQHLQSFKEQIMEDLENYSQNEVITKTQYFIGIINNLSEKNIEELEIDHNFQIIHEIVPEYNQFMYELKNFSHLNENVVYSSNYNLNGTQWRLKIYPRGNGIAKEKCISVFLELFKAYQNQVKYQYKIQLINNISDVDSIIRQYSSKFDIGECWGYNQFVELENLDQGFLVDDKLVFKFFIRNANYRSLCLDQKRYTAKLEDNFKRSQLKKKSMNLTNSLLEREQSHHNMNSEIQENELSQELSLQNRFRIYPNNEILQKEFDLKQLLKQ